MFSVALLSAGSGTANTDDDAGCDVTAGPPDSSSLGSSCNRMNPILLPLLLHITYIHVRMIISNTQLLFNDSFELCNISGSHFGVGISLRILGCYAKSTGTDRHFTQVQCLQNTGDY